MRDFDFAAPGYVAERADANPDWIANLTSHRADTLNPYIVDYSLFAISELLPATIETNFRIRLPAMPAMPVGPVGPVGPVAPLFEGLVLLLGAITMLAPLFDAKSKVVRRLSRPRLILFVLEEYDIVNAGMVIIRSEPILDESKQIVDGGVSHRNEQPLSDTTGHVLTTYRCLPLFLQLTDITRGQLIGQETTLQVKVWTLWIRVIKAHTAVSRLH